MKFITTIFVAIFMTFSANSQELNLQWKVPNSNIYSVNSDSTHFYISGSSSWSDNCGHGFKVTTGSDRYDKSFPYIDLDFDIVENDGDSCWIIKGYFSNIGSVKRNRLARISIDGRVDENWNPLKNTKLSVYNVSNIFNADSNLFISFEDGSIVKYKKNEERIDSDWKIQQKSFSNIKEKFVYKDFVYFLTSHNDFQQYNLIKLHINEYWNYQILNSFQTEKLSNKQVIIEPDTSSGHFFVFVDSTVTKYKFSNHQIVGSISIEKFHLFQDMKIDGDFIYLFIGDTVKVFNKNSLEFVREFGLGFSLYQNTISIIMKDDFIYIGGRLLFSIKNPNGSSTYYRYLTRFNKLSGKLDTTWVPAPSNYVWGMGFCGDALLVGGSFNRVNATNYSPIVRVNKHDNKIDTTWSSGSISAYNFLLANDYIYLCNATKPINYKVSNPIQRISKKTGLIDNNWSTSLMYQLPVYNYTLFSVLEMIKYKGTFFVRGVFENEFNARYLYICQINESDGTPVSTWEPILILRINGIVSLEIHNGVLYFYYEDRDTKSYEIRGINIETGVLVLKIEGVLSRSFNIADDYLYYNVGSTIRRVNLIDHTIEVVCEQLYPDGVSKLIVKNPFIYIFFQDEISGIDLRRFNITINKYDETFEHHGVNNFYITSDKMFLNGDVSYLNYYNRYPALIFDLDSNKQMVKLVAPKDDSTNTPHKLVFTWKSLYFANTYQIQISEDIEFGSTFFDSSVNGTEKYVSGLVNGKTYYWRVRALFGSDSTVWSDIWSFTTDAVISVPEETEIPSRIRLYPNPANEMLNIVLPEFSANQYFEIVDIRGRKLQSGYLSGISTEINISHLPKGVYFIKAGNETAKFIKE